MNNVNTSLGSKVITINGRHTLSFNPEDPTLYDRFCTLLGEITEAGERISNEAKRLKDDTEVDKWGIPTKGHKMAELMIELDGKVKERLQYVFGAGNDFDAIFDGVNVFAGTETGEWVISNFLNALRPEIESISEERMKAKAAAAHLNREQRRSAQRR